MLFRVIWTPYAQPSFIYHSHRLMMKNRNKLNRNKKGECVTSFSKLFIHTNEYEYEHQSMIYKFQENKQRKYIIHNFYVWCHIVRHFYNKFILYGDIFQFYSKFISL